MKNNVSIADRLLFGGALLLGAATVAWTASIFVAGDALALAVTFLIGGVFTIGSIELIRYGQATASLARALAAADEATDSLDDWLERLDPSLRNAVRLRVEGERVGLPAPVLTPYLVGLLVMLGLLGTFVGMVDTLQGAVTALDGAGDLQAIRQGLAAPINGLGMAFGTSVAGVATSAMLGLMATLSRRRRMLVTRHLDAIIPIAFKAFSLVHSQRETFRSLRQQTRSLPAVSGMLETVAGKLDRLCQTLVDNQAHFNHSVATQYAGLAESMEQALKDNLAANARRVREAVEPAVDSAMQAISRESEAAFVHLARISRQTIDEIEQQLTRQSQDAAASWSGMAATQRQAADTLIARMDAALNDFSDGAGQRAASLLDQFAASAAKWLEQQAADDRERMARWRASVDADQQQSAARLGDAAAALTAELRQVADAQQAAFDTAARKLQDVSAALADDWRMAGQASQARQEALSAMLAETIEALQAQMQEMGTHAHAQMGRLVESSEQLIRSRQQAESAWLDDQAGRMDALATSVAGQLRALRDDEAHRGHAAVARLEQLESVLTTHLATLGQALEAPMTRLMETAADAPRSAATLVEEMRQSAASQLQRDNRLLEARRETTEQLDTLCAALGDNLNGQKDAIETLIESAGGMLAAAGHRFAEQMDRDLSTLSTATDTVAVSAVEMASLGESFGKAVELFTATSDRLQDGLDRIEDALEKTAARSDEQMGYFVAQAREIIEYAMLSQKEIIDEMRRLRPDPNLDLEAN